MDFHSLCIHGTGRTKDGTGAVSVPIYQTTIFSHPGVGQSTGYDYSRIQNPTREHLEAVLAKLENGTRALAFSSGMAAIATVMELYRPGDHVLISDDLYGGSDRLFRLINQRLGLHFEAVDTSDLEAVRAAVKRETKAVFVETPTNPMMKITDLEGMAALTKEHGLQLIVDNTFLTPFLLNPLDLGADIVLHSGTKYLCGHNDVLAGVIVVKTEELYERLHFIYKNTGACLSPFDSWLLIRGIKTLGIRVERQQQNALEIAGWLERHPKVRKVYYAGLQDHPGYEVMKRQARGFGGMISFSVDSEETARKVLENIQMIFYAESLGGVESLLTYPLIQTHADVPREECIAKGIDERLLRMSVGIEDCGDLIADLAQAFDK